MSVPHFKNSVATWESVHFGADAPFTAAGKEPGSFTGSLALPALLGQMNENEVFLEPWANNRKKPSICPIDLCGRARVCGWGHMTFAPKFPGNCVTGMIGLTVRCQIHVCRWIPDVRCWRG